MTSKQIKSQPLLQIPLRKQEQHREISANKLQDQRHKYLIEGRREEEYVHDEERDG